MAPRPSVFVLVEVPVEDLIHSSDKRLSKKMYFIRMSAYSINMDRLYI